MKRPFNMVQALSAGRVIAAVVTAWVVVTAAATCAADALPIGDWEQRGLTAQKRSQIENAFQQGIRRKVIPGGALLIIHRGEAVMRQGFGAADLATGRPFTPETPCRIASVTKPHTATVIAMLVDQGKLTLTDPVDEWLPEFRNINGPNGKPARAPTLAECLSHTSGFSGNDVIKRGELAFGFEGTLAETVRRLAMQPLVAEPGTRWAYSRLGYMTAGRAAEAVTGQDFRDLMREVLLQPIGADQATFTITPELKERLALAYERGPDGLNVLAENPEWATRTPNPGGGLVSTLDDVGRLLLLHRNHGRVGGRQIVKPEALAAMYVAQPATNGKGYGLGFNVLKTRNDGSTSRIQHAGASGTLAWLDFDADVAVVVLTQVPNQQITPWRNQLLRTIGEVFGADERQPR